MLAIPTTAYAEKVPVMVISKIIDRAMNVITKGKLARAMEGPTLVQSCLGHSSCPTTMQEWMELLLKGHPLPPALTPLHIRSLTWLTSRATSIPLRRSQTLHLGL